MNENPFLGVRINADESLRFELLHEDRDEVALEPLEELRRDRRVLAVVGVAGLLELEEVPAHHLVHDEDLGCK